MTILIIFLSFFHSVFVSKVSTLSSFLLLYIIKCSYFISGFGAGNIYAYTSYT